MEAAGARLLRLVGQRGPGPSCRTVRQAWHVPWLPGGCVSRLDVHPVGLRGQGVTGEARGWLAFMRGI